MGISNRTKRKVKGLGAVMCVAGLSGGTYSMVSVGSIYGPLGPFFQGALDGFIIGFIIGYYQLFLAWGYLADFFRKLSFTMTVLINSLIYLSVILGGLLIGFFFTHPDIDAFEARFSSSTFFESMVFAFILALILNFIIQMTRLVGQNVLINFLTGTYHRPKDEERLFMFLDMESSTEFAERIGDVKFHGLLNRFFYDLTDAVLETDGEIYEYVGDEVVISWKKEKGIKGGNCLRCYFLIKDKIKENSQKYMQEFGVAPGFRAVVHGGKVVAGELGGLRQKIAYVGDVLNTTARVMDFCRDEKHRFVVTGQVIDEMDSLPDLQIEDMGTLQPRGEQETLEVYSVEKKG